MVNHKCVQFQAKGTKTPKDYHKFEEPEGMTSIDLKSVKTTDRKFIISKPRKRQYSKGLSKYLIKSLVIITFLIFGTVTFLTVLPQKEINNLESFWSHLISANTSDTNQRDVQFDNIEKCKTTKTYEDCCLSNLDLGRNIGVENCTIDAILTAIAEKSILAEETAFDDDLKASDYIPVNDFYNAYNKFLEEEYFNSKNLDIKQTENEDYNKYDINFETIPTEMPPDIFFQPKESKTFYNFIVKITNMSRPMADGKNLNFETENTSIKMKFGKNISKRSVDNENYHRMDDTGAETRNFQNFVREEMLKDYFDEDDTLHGDKKEYHDIVTENANAEKDEDSEKDLNLRINLPNTNKEKHFSLTPEDLPNQDSFNINSKQCIPYSPQVGAAFPFLQPQMNPYPYDPNMKFSPLVPMPKNPNSFIVNPYLNPPFQPSPYSNFYPQYLPFPNQQQAPPGQYYLCNPIPTPVNQIANFPGVEVRQNANSDENVEDVGDVINSNRAFRKCPVGEIVCEHGSKCIKAIQICDNFVDCPDGSDEVFCSCKDRIGDVRFCDGYIDCPGGEDEIDCFGCDSDSFNCDDWTADNEMATCISLEQRCDGIRQCPTGKDEEDCSVLTESFGKVLPQYQVSIAKGFLYRNYKGNWYPTCTDVDDWAFEVCKKETGTTLFPPTIHLLPTRTFYKGSYINKISENEVDLISNCIPGFAVHVECPPPNCGVRNLVKSPYRVEDIDTSSEDEISRFRHKRNGSDILGSGRVVGGKPSQPAAWPWVVTIYRNGFFHCGGVIISDSWIVTAAHCVDRFTQYYFEIDAGILRRFSYSPMQETRHVTHVITHNAYDRSNLKNDLAMMKLSKPLIFNRYIRPICLPTEFTAGNSYRKGPKAGTLCTAVGWGATKEHGTDPDHLREVEVPILSHCKHREDEEGQEICAGFTEGGRDACQGDSGGPFMCRNPNKLDQWYLAGVVSHGEGCARPNEPGVYTRVSLYMDWMFGNVHEDPLPTRRPLQDCPGYICKSSKKCLPKKNHCDRVVDCLLGDDEIHCEKRNFVDKLFRNSMKHILVDITRNEENSEKYASSTTTSNKLGVEVTTSTVVTREPATTLITDGGNTLVATVFADNIFGSTAFKMENSTTTTTNELNRNDFGYTTATTVEDTSASSFASSPNVSDEGQSIIYVPEIPTTLTATNTDETTKVTDLFERVTETETVPTATTITSVSSTIMLLPPPTRMRQNNGGGHFMCTEMLQVIPMAKRCNKVADCEDVSDERNCSCADYLRNFHPMGICDGTIDCFDLSDEENCGEPCTEEEFHCSVTHTCIAINKKCDNVPDCPHNEDEWDCFALTDGVTVQFDRDLRPHLNTKGIVTFYYHQRDNANTTTISSSSTWLPMCGDNWNEFQSSVAGELCLSLGFSDYVRYAQKRIDNEPLKIEIDGKNSTFHDGLDRGLFSNRIDICNGLYVKCSNVTARWSFSENGIPPWNAVIYADGEFKCTGTLLNLNWILTSSNCFPGMTQLNLHYVVALLGTGGRYLDVVGPHEQIRLVVESIPVLYSDAVLLRLEQNAVHTRYVRPAHFEMHGDIYRPNKRCHATGRNKNNKLIYIELMRIRNCTSGSRCFKRSQPNTQDCDNTEKSWSGTIVCESGNGFFPSAIFHEKQGACGFQHTSSYTSLSLLKRAIFNLFERLNGILTVYPKECDGFRCTLGQCIELPRICDGIPDCRGGEDENELICRDRNVFCHLSGTCECAKNELKCKTNRCLPKSTFCNKIKDCEDGSDEPDVCNCLAYLKLTNPEKICDGIRNCHDRSDENPIICPCRTNYYTCNKSNICLPMEMVCDNHSDCPHGEDEENCIKLQPFANNENSGEVMRNTGGIWHRGCFGPNLSREELNNICNRLGFVNPNATYIKLPHSSDLTTNKPIFDPFNLVWLNRSPESSFKLAIRDGNSPFVSFVNSTDCYRLFIQCL